MFRTSDSLENNYLLDYKSYRFTHESVEEGVFWVGIIVDEESQLVLDCKWWAPRIESDIAKLCQDHAATCVGKLFSECPQITIPTTSEA